MTKRVVGSEKHYEKLNKKLVQKNNELTELIEQLVKRIDALTKENNKLNKDNNDYMHIKNLTDEEIREFIRQYKSLEPLKHMLSLNNIITKGLIK